MPCSDRALLHSAGFSFISSFPLFRYKKDLSSRQAGRRVGFSFEEEDRSKSHKSVSLLGVLMD
jgi:hypothetical protein